MNDADTKDERQAPAWPDMGEGWYVTVGRRGHDLLTITDTSYSGCTDPEPGESLIVGAAQHLLAFVGYGLPSSDFAPDDSVPQAEYGYTEAFYQISALLGIGAQDATPETVFKTQMLPKLRALIEPAEAVRQPLTAEQSVAWLRNLPIPPAEAVRQPLTVAYRVEYKPGDYSHIGAKYFRMKDHEGARVHELLLGKCINEPLQDAEVSMIFPPPDEVIQQTAGIAELARAVLDTFATPPAAAVRQPLTEEQITAAMHEADWPPAMLSPAIESKLRQFARAVERAIAAAITGTQE